MNCSQNKQNFSSLPTKTWQGAHSVLDDGTKRHRDDVPETKIGENTPPSLPLTILPRKRVDRKKEVRTFLAILLFLPKDHSLSHFQKSVDLPTENAPSLAKVMGGGKFRISLPTHFLFA